MAHLGQFRLAVRAPPMNRPANYGLNLPGIYLVWLCVVLALYAPCRWFASLKQHSREWWWSYL
jgi:hypothetical protein